MLPDESLRYLSDPDSRRLSVDVVDSGIPLLRCRCRLSKRQRTLYEDYMASSDTSATLASSNFLGIINVLMQLRKVRFGTNL